MPLVGEGYVCPKPVCGLARETAIIALAGLNCIRARWLEEYPDYPECPSSAVDQFDKVGPIANLAGLDQQIATLETVNRCTGLRRSVSVSPEQCGLSDSAWRIIAGAAAIYKNYTAVSGKTLEDLDQREIEE